MSKVNPTRWANSLRISDAQCLSGDWMSFTWISYLTLPNPAAHVIFLFSVTIYMDKLIAQRNIRRLIKGNKV